MGLKQTQVTVDQVTYFVNKLSEMLNNDETWPEDGLGLVFVEFFCIYQHKRNNLSLEEFIEQIKGLWNTLDRMEQGYPDPTEPIN